MVESASNPLKNCRVRYGDLWQLGNHRLLCGDSTNPADVARLMQGERARLTITSPPYNLGRSAGLAANRAMGQSKYLHAKDSRSTEEYLMFLRRFTDLALSVSEVVIVNLQMLAGNKLAFLEYLYHMRQDLIDIAVWDKQCAPPAMARNVLTSQFEWLLFLTTQTTKGRTTRAIPTADFRGTVRNVYRGIQQRGNRYFRQHAATFPLHLPSWLMETFDSQRGIILDPFLGTGTTIIAAEESGRRCLGIEIEPIYCAITLARFEQATGRAAHLIERRAEHVV